MTEKISEQLLRLPKVELHRHLEGAVRLDTVKELAMQLGIALPAREDELRDKVLVTQPMSSLGAVLDRFWLTQSVLASEEILERIAFEACEDAFREGIRLLELRYAPSFVQINHPNLPYEKIHRAIVKGVRRAEKTFPLAVGLIGILVRVDPLDVVARAADFIIDHRDSFLGVDLAGDEAVGETKTFAPFFMKAKKAGLRITVHAGEADIPGAPQYVIDAIDHLGAERIGHGLQIYRDKHALKYVRDSGVTLELCPTSNWYTNAVKSLEVHPLRYLMEKGIKVTLNSDDPGIFGIDLTHEYGVAARSLKFTLDELRAVANQGARSSFIPDGVKKKLWPSF